MQVVFSGTKRTDSLSRRGMFQPNNVAFLPSAENRHQQVSSQTSFAVRAAMIPKVSFRGGLGKFTTEAMTPAHPNWEKATARLRPHSTIISGTGSPFEQDYTQIVNSLGFAKLKGKRQVMISHTSGESCSRMDHCIQVANVAKRICKGLGLNADLAEAIGFSHDIGHAPFGHSGERAIKQIIKDKGIDEIFWHEKNGLHFVDNIETLENRDGRQEPINLTYALRDGIICHCGEVDENAIKPRTDFMDLHTMTVPGQYQPATWEGCVTKISDKVAYAARDIEDSIRDGVIDAKKKKELLGIASKALGTKVKALNPRTITDFLIADLVQHSSPEEGLSFSHTALNFINGVKKFNLEKIYIGPEKLEKEKHDALALNGIYNSLERMYDGKNTLKKLQKANSKHLASSFEGWLRKYSTARTKADAQKYANPVVYKIEDKKDYQRAIIHYLSSLTDAKANELFNESRQTLKD